MILDSNIVIYAAADPSAPELSEFIRPRDVAVASVVLIEVYGFPRITEKERRALDVLFRGWTILPLDAAVIASAIEVRSLRRMGLGMRLSLRLRSSMAGRSSLGTWPILNTSRVCNS